MEKYVVDQIKYGVKYVPSNIIKSFFSDDGKTVCQLRKDMGFIRGVCHPRENYEQIKNANIEWIRIDIPFPFDKNGELSDSYIGFKERARAFNDNGIKVMAVTPYPSKYIEAGINVKTRAGDKKLADIAVFLLEDLRGLVSGFQITNEMGIPHFTLPLNLGEAAHFIGVQLMAMYRKRGDIIIGYNSAGPQADLHEKMKPYFKFCDYIGIDIYIGCFMNVGGLFSFFGAMCRYLHEFTKKPILIQEFGYISGGAPKSAEEKKAILNSYGADSEADAAGKIVSVVDKLPESFSQHIKKVSCGDESRYYKLLFKSDLVNHFYRELPKTTLIPGCPHTPEGQARFYSKILPSLYKKGYICGTIIYCWSDSERCYICGQSDCPTETRWGLVTNDEKEKPSYYAVKKEFAKMK